MTDNNMNQLGLNKIQLTVIKSSFNSSKAIRKMIEKEQKKAEAISEKLQLELDNVKAKYEEKSRTILEELNAYKQQLEALDAPIVQITQKACGIGLTAEQCMNFIENPQKFEEYKQSIGMSQTLFDQAEQEQSEDDREAA